MGSKIIEVKVIPKSSKIEIVQRGDSVYKIKLTEPPEKDKANKQLIEILAKYFNLDKKNLKIVSGFHSFKKKILINEGME